MTREERKIALYCLKAYSDYHSEVCEECINYPNCDHTMQDDVTETIIKELEQEPCEDAISREDLIQKFYDDVFIRDKTDSKEDYQQVFASTVLAVIKNMPSVTPTEKWIPLSERPMTDEERKEYGAEEGFVYDCELPEDSQDVLVTTPYGVRQTTFYTDYGCYFENYEDEGDVIAWMPLPEPYKEVGRK